MTEADPAASPDTVWPLLADAYSTIEESWHGFISTALTGSTAPRDPGIPGGSPQSTVLSIGYMSGMLAASAITAHLDLLSRAYWPPRTERDFTPIDQPALYPPARAVLEAAGIVCWTLNGRLDTKDRLLHSAELWLWSATSSRNNDQVKAVEGIRAAGFTVAQRRGRGKPTLTVNGQHRAPLTISQMIRSMFGDFGVAMYGLWSSTSHSDPFHIYDAVQEAFGDDGVVSVGFKIEPVYHLLTAGIVANAILAAAKCLGVFARRDTSSVEVDCDRLIRETLRIMPMFDPQLRKQIGEIDKRGRDSAEARSVE